MRCQARGGDLDIANLGRHTRPVIPLQPARTTPESQVKIRHRQGENVCDRTRESGQRDRVARMVRRDGDMRCPMGQKAAQAKPAKTGKSAQPGKPGKSK
jgi:hypothetical protein